jgi:carboxypeptidase Q
MDTMFYRALVLIATLVLAPTFTWALDGDLDDVEAKIRTAENEHSQIMSTEHWLTDVYGPRLTGSPDAEAAAHWALAEMRRWSLQDGRLEPWAFGHAGWSNLSATGFIVSPVRAQLDLRVTAWTPGTHGELHGEAIVID